MYLSDVCLFYFFFTIYENINQAENEHNDCYYSKTVNFLLKVTIRGLLVESPKVLSVPRKVARFFPLLFEVRSCQVELFTIPRRVLPN